MIFCFLHIRGSPRDHATVRRFHRRETYGREESALLPSDDRISFVENQLPRQVKIIVGLSFYCCWKPRLSKTAVIVLLVLQLVTPAPT